MRFNKVADLPPDALNEWLMASSRETLQNWLIWCDHNGIYSDNDCIREFGVITTKQEFIESIKRILG